MGRFLIEGGVPLCGRVRVGGSKNGALPVLFATLLSRGVSVIDNLPDIGDVSVALKILSSLGVRYRREGDRLTVDSSEAVYASVCEELTSALRASTYLMGACLGAFGKCSIPTFGGCNFAPRPIDLHLSAFTALGCVIGEDGIDGSRLRGGSVSLPLPSVGATVNALLVASSLDGHSVIKCAAGEPHIDCLIDFLRSMGAGIDRAGDTLTVRGGDLTGGYVRIPGDMIEGGSYLASGIVSGGTVTVEGLDPAELAPLLTALSDSGVLVEQGADSVTVCGRPRQAIELTARPYPGFPTDLQPIVAPILAIGAGGVLRDTVFRGRFGYLRELGLLGVGYELRGDGAHIYPSTPVPGNATACDLRGGMATILWALASVGRSEISDARIVMRGYSDLCRRLDSLGAAIKYCE